MTDTSWEATFERVLYIRYSVRFYRKNNKNEDKNIRALIDLGSEVNAMHPAYTTNLGFYAKKINVGAQKIDGPYLDIFEIVIADYLVKNKLERV